MPPLHDLVPDDRLQLVGRKRVKLPAVLAVLGDVGRRLAVALLRRLRRRVEALHLVHVESDADDRDLGAREHLQLLAQVPCHVDARGVVVAQVEDDGALPARVVVREASASPPHLAQRVVALGAEEVNALLVAYLADDALQRLLLAPGLKTDGLVGPEVALVLGAHLLDRLRRPVVGPVPHQVAAAVLDRRPRDEPRQAGLAEQVLQPAILALLVRDQTARDVLVVELSHRQRAAVLREDHVDRLDAGHLRAVERAAGVVDERPGGVLVVHVLNAYHRVPSA